MTSVQFPADLTIDALRSAAMARLQTVTDSVLALKAERDATMATLQESGDRSPPMAYIAQFTAKTLTLIGEKDVASREIQKAVRQRRRLCGSRVDMEGERLLRDVAAKYAVALREFAVQEGAPEAEVCDDDWAEFERIMSVDPAATPDIPHRELHVALLSRMNAVMDSPSAALPERSDRHAWYTQMALLRTADLISTEASSMSSVLSGLLSGRRKEEVYRSVLRKVLQCYGEAAPDVLSDDSLFDATHAARIDYLIHRNELADSLKADGDKERCGVCGGTHR